MLKKAQFIARDICYFIKVKASVILRKAQLILLNLYYYAKIYVLSYFISINTYSFEFLTWELFKKLKLHEAEIIYLDDI